MHEYFENNTTGGVIIMELLEGIESLKDWLHKSKGTLLPKREMIDMQIEMVETLVYLHEKAHTIHVDLHAGNWLRKENGEIIMIDFGAANYLGSPEGYKKGDSKPLWIDPENGKAVSPIYCAPE
jgi:predicted unusual protein kinase regulating ubiquinone biosynthesis (AarF/ABC1/UbiB family)